MRASDPVARMTFFALTLTGFAVGTRHFDGQHTVLRRAGQLAVAA